MKPALRQRTVGVCLGESAIPIGQLSHMKSGPRESSSFAYDSRWLQSPDRFTVSPDLDLVAERQFRKAPTHHDSAFHFAITDTEPGGWGCRIIAREHAKRRKEVLAGGNEWHEGALTELDYLLGVDDVSRIGALRLRDEHGHCLRTIEDGATTPALLELGPLIGASHAVELGRETAADLRYLRGRGTSIGGMRPKCTVVDEDGHLAVAKFPSVNDERCVTKGEVLALHLAEAAGIAVADARIVHADGMPVALVRRFDRARDGGRIPYLSAASMLQASRQDDHAYTEIADCIIATGAEPGKDLAELWRRIAFNLLITNVDDHLQNHGFLHVAHGQWRLSPGFDINPFPDRDRESKTWLTEDTGPVTSIVEVVQAARYFWLEDAEALRMLSEVRTAIRSWKELARLDYVGMTDRDIEDFLPAFEHEQARLTDKLLRR